MNLTPQIPSMRINLIPDAGLGIDVDKTRRAANTRLWASKNREKVREYTRRFRENNPEKIRAWAKRNSADRLSIPENRVVHSLRACRDRAAKSGIEFNITIKDLLPLPILCPISGIRLNYKGTGGKRGFVSDCASIDRIDSSKGYIPGNVQIISWRMNRIKADATMEELWLILNYMVPVCG